MVWKDGDTLVGYSVFETFEECYQYNENACFVASDVRGAEVFLRAGFAPAEECRIDPVSFSDLMRDFGCSSGEYALERDAFERFRTIAELNGISWQGEPYDGDDSLLVVEIDGARSSDA